MTERSDSAGTNQTPPKTLLKDDRLPGQIEKPPTARPGPSPFNLPVLLIAARLSQLQSMPREKVIVPSSVAQVHNELMSATAVAREVLRRGNPRCRKKLIGKLGGCQPLDRPPGTGSSRRYGISSLVMMDMAAEGSIHGLPCADYPPHDLDILRAGFQLDAELGFRDARLTQRAAEYVRERRGTLAAYGEALERFGAAPARPAGGPDDDQRFRRGTDIGGSGSPRRDPVVPGVRPPGSAGGIPPRNPSIPLFPPGTDISDVPEPPMPSGGFDLCRDISDICIDLFNSFASASLNDADAQLIASVSPECICHDGYTEQTEFTAYPDPTRAFPAQQGEYRLIFRGDDITDRITSWSATEIRFTIIAGSHSGFVYLQRFVNTPHRGIGRRLARLCGIPEAAEAAGVLSPSPRAVLAIVYPPIVEDFRIEGRTTSGQRREACRAVKIEWSVRVADQSLGRLLPPCVTLETEVRVGDGRVLHRSTDAVGRWFHNTDATSMYYLRVRSLSGNDVCGETGSNEITVERTRHVHIEPQDPGAAEIVAGRSGTLTIRISCAAPPEGLSVALNSTNRDTLRLPNTVLILPGESAARVQFGTRQSNHGTVTLTATLAGHESGELDYTVVEFLTAISLSGGGAKGSFEVGALLYLKEVWLDLRPTIVCGTSVGAINAVALAETQSSTSVDKLEQIWLSLRTHADMYLPTPELLSMLGNLELDYEAFLNTLNSSERGISGVSFWNLVDEGAIAGGAAIGFLLGGPLGGLLGGAIATGVDLSSAVGALENALRDASSILSLAPIRAALDNNVDPAAVAASGMKLRLATVALEDGYLYYITESGELFRDRARAPDWSETIIDSDALFRGVLASAAFPGLFPAESITTATCTRTYVDGGVREVQPAFAAVELGAQLIFVISASPVGPGPASGFTGDFKLPKIALRAVDLSVTEVSEEEMVPRAGFCDDRERILIAPSFPVHGTTEIDPGLIRINMAYGYMKAFDRDQLRRGNINAIAYLLWNAVTDEIITRRLRCHELEREIGDHGLIHADSPDWLRTIRTHKNRIAELMEERFDTFGADAFPRKMANNLLRDYSTLDWSGTWEMHLEPRQTRLDDIDLWQPQIVEYGSVGGDGPGHPPVVETNVAAQYQLPAAMIAALQNR